MKRARVAVNGYGVIGKRVADAVSLQDDMELAGVAAVTPDWRIRVAVERGYPVYGSTLEATERMREARIPVAGTLDDLLAKSDLVADCAPKRLGAANRDRYVAAGVKAIFQGGEKHDTAGLSFVAEVNYAQALGRPMARVVSCNTTGLTRVLYPLHQRGWVKKARAVLFRRTVDPSKSHRSAALNTVVPELVVPSHQGPDARTVIPGLEVVTLAAAGSHDLGHIHFLMVETTRPVSVDELRAALHEAPRVAFVRGSDGLVAMNSLSELMRDLLRPRGDMWEVAVWEDALASEGSELYLTYQVHNEAIVVPDTIDCIRALLELERSGARSIAKTDAAMGIVRQYLPKSGD